MTPVVVWTEALEAHRPRPFEPSGHRRVTVVAAHPDDETLGASGCLQALHRAGAEVTLVVATDGEAAYPALDPAARRDLARARRAELVAALRVQGLGDVAVHWLGLPDSGLDDRGPELRAALRPLLAGADAYLAPWAGDPHPDHRAAGLAAADAAPVTAHGWAYPVWMWAWLTPDDPAVPWDRARLLRLDAAAAVAKRAAIAAFTSQVGPGPDGSPPVLDAGMLAHAGRPAELLFRIARSTSAPVSRFTELYADGADPWRADSWYERRKRAVVLASLPRERYRRAFEPGCGTGELTLELAARCGAVLASDPVAEAVRRARAAHCGRRRASGSSRPHCPTPCRRSRSTSRSSARSSTTSTTPPCRPRSTAPSQPSSPAGTSSAVHWRGMAGGGAARRGRHPPDAARPTRAPPGRRARRRRVRAARAAPPVTARGHADLPVTAVGVVVPARNEQDRIVRCLAGLRRALAHAPDGVATAVAIVLDRCTDATPEKVARRIGDWPEATTITVHDDSLRSARRSGGRCRPPPCAGAGSAPGATWACAPYWTGSPATPRPGPGYSAPTPTPPSRTTGSRRTCSTPPTASTRWPASPTSARPTTSPTRRWRATARSSSTGCAAPPTTTSTAPTSASAPTRTSPSAASPPTARARTTGCGNDSPPRGYTLAQPVGIRVRTSARLRGRADGGLAGLLRALHRDGHHVNPVTWVGDAVRDGA